LKQRMMEVVSGDNWTTGAISRAKLQSNHHHQQTNIQFFLQAGCPSCRPTNSVKALKGNFSEDYSLSILTAITAARNLNCPLIHTLNCPSMQVD